MKSRLSAQGTSEPASGRVRAPGPSRVGGRPGALAGGMSERPLPAVRAALHPFDPWPAPRVAGVSRAGRWGPAARSGAFVARGRVVMGLLFFPRGGSAQVARYLAVALGDAGWSVPLVTG